MVERLLSVNPREEIIIIDNDSTYEPLINWYNKLAVSWGMNIQVRYHKNYGHTALWGTEIYKELGDYFIYTDSDIILPESLPLDWKKIMFSVMESYPEYNKIALGLRIDDLPDHYRYKNQVIRNESRWWVEEIEKNIFRADTDTTFALMKNFGDNCYNSLRICRPDLLCRHHGWYLDLTNLDEEEKYYLANVSDQLTTQYSKQHKYPEVYTDI